MNIGADILIAMISCFVGILGAFQAWKRYEKKEAQTENSNMVTLRSDIKYITKQLEKLDNSLQRIDSKFDDSMERLVKVESDVQTLYHYKDEFSQRIERLEHATKC